MVDPLLMTAIDWIARVGAPAAPVFAILWWIERGRTATLEAARDAMVRQHADDLRSQYEARIAQGAETAKTMSDTLRTGDRISDALDRQSEALGDVLDVVNKIAIRQEAGART
jgi:NAD(P)H-dependent FMN reductase